MYDEGVWDSHPLKPAAATVKNLKEEKKKTGKMPYALGKC